MTITPIGSLDALLPPAAGTIDAAADEVERYVLAVRLLGYLGRDHDAVALAGEAVATHPDNARLLRLRGEKRLLTRDPRGAAADLEAATDRLVAGHDIGERYREDVEAAVLAHVLGRPSPVADHRAQRLQLRAVTWHHLGVARYLLGEFSAAADAFSEAVAATAVTRCDDHVGLASIDWGYLALRRSGRDHDAEASLLALDGVELRGDQAPGGSVALSLAESYCQRLRMYRGELGPEVLLRNDAVGPLAVATLGYGVGAWYLLGGYPDAAQRVWRRVLDLGDPASSGYLAAETDLERC